MEEKVTANRGWSVTLAGTGINLALGVLYAWSIIVGNVEGWTQTMKSVPYSLACFVFAAAMIPAGRLQDKLSPRVTASIGGVLTGFGFIVCALMNSFSGYLIGFGVLAGLGIGFGYASATPPAIKWFSAAKTGLIAGVVVSGFGLASAYIGPLVGWLVSVFELQTTIFILGVAFLVIVVGLAQVLRNPPSGYKPAESVSATKKARIKTSLVAESGMRDFNWKEMVKTSQFWILWSMFACGSGAGLMVIGKIKPMLREAGGDATWFVPLALALLAVGNSAGRIVAGVVSDRIGRTMTMFLIFVVQAGVMAGLMFLGNIAVVAIILAIMAGFNYGSNLSVFPSATKDLFGLKNFGFNYGIMFSAWGAGGVVLPIISGLVADATGSFNLAYIIATVCLIVASILSFMVRRKGPVASTT